jgi:hypothetical protein
MQDLTPLPRQEQPERHERKHPRQVEVEPVGEGGLEGEENGRRQRRQLDRALASGKERDQERECRDERLQHGLEEPEIRNAAGVILAPAPERER